MLAGVAGAVGGEQEKRNLAGLFRCRDFRSEKTRAASVAQAEFF